MNSTGGLFQYLIPTAADVPDVEAVILESGEGMGPFGARGLLDRPLRRRGSPAPSTTPSASVPPCCRSRPSVLACVERGNARAKE